METSLGLFLPNAQQMTIAKLQEMFKHASPRVHRLSHKEDKEVEEKINKGVGGRPRKYSVTPAQANAMFESGITILEIAKSSEPEMCRDYTAAMIDKFRKAADLPTRPKPIRHYKSIRVGLSAGTLLRVPEVEALLGKHSITQIGFMLKMHHKTVHRMVVYIDKNRKPGEAKPVRNYTSVRVGLSEASMLRVPEVEALLGKYSPSRIGLMLKMHHRTVHRITFYINEQRGKPKSKVSYW